MKHKLRQYYHLTKPGIIRGNVMVTSAAFLYASAGNINFSLLVALIIGTSFIIASSCVFNNIHDLGMDSKMKRTKKRALVTGEIKVKSAVIFGLILALLGYLILLRYTNFLTAFIGFIGMFFYLAIYTPAKPRTFHAALLGSISGAVPPLAGYSAVTNTIDGPSMMLFLIMAIWQMPHFYAIAIFRAEEYKAANIPVLSLVKSKSAVQKQITYYIAAFVISVVAFYFVGDMSMTYLVFILLAGSYWLKISIDGSKAKDLNKWAKKVFGTSLLVLLVFSLLISIDNFLL